MSLSLIAAKKSDLPKIYALQKAAFRSLYETYHNEKTSPFKEPLKSLKRKFDRSENDFFLIQKKKEIIGFIKITSKDEKKQ